MVPVHMPVTHRTRSPSINMHLHQALAALADANLLAAGAGCTSDSMHALKQRVNWSQIEIAPVIQGLQACRGCRDLA
jgi:N-dimethylarginine dimethylaminohydrolase